MIPFIRHKYLLFRKGKRYARWTVHFWIAQPFNQLKFIYIQNENVMAIGSGDIELSIIPRWYSQSSRSRTLVPNQFRRKRPGFVMFGHGIHVFVWIGNDMELVLLVIVLVVVVNAFGNLFQSKRVRIKSNPGFAEIADLIQHFRSFSVKVQVGCHLLVVGVVTGFCTYFFFKS